jgi:hypothetical protein
VPGPLDAALIAAGFEDTLKGALRAADVLGTDETPAPLATAATCWARIHDRALTCVFS